jgi:uncharacterized membrane protein
MTVDAQRAASADVEHLIARVLLGGAVAGILFLAVGVVLMAVAGISPMAETFPPFVPGALLADIVALRPEGFLWAGIVILVATPIARVIGELVTYAVRGDRVLALVAVGILGVIALSVVAALIFAG